MYGKECVFIREKTDMKFSAQQGHWVGGVYQPAKSLAIKRHTCQHSGVGAEEKISLLIT